MGLAHDGFLANKLRNPTPQLHKIRGRLYRLRPARIPKRSIFPGPPEYDPCLRSSTTAFLPQLMLPKVWIIVSRLTNSLHRLDIEPAKESLLVGIPLLKQLPLLQTRVWWTLLHATLQYQEPRNPLFQKYTRRLLQAGARLILTCHFMSCPGALEHPRRFLQGSTSCAPGPSIDPFLVYSK